jgi:hypothetical protein
MLENGLEKCTCKKKDCERYGKCDLCIEFHKKINISPIAREVEEYQAILD